MGVLSVEQAWQETPAEQHIAATKENSTSGLTIGCRGAQRSRWRRAATGFLLGALLGLAAGELNLDALVHQYEHMVLAFGAVGAVVGLTRARAALWIVDGILVVLL